MTTAATANIPKEMIIFYDIFREYGQTLEEYHSIVNDEVDVYRAGKLLYELHEKEVAASKLCKKIFGFSPIEEIPLDIWPVEKAKELGWSEDEADEVVLQFVVALVKQARRERQEKNMEKPLRVMVDTNILLSAYIVDGSYIQKEFEGEAERLGLETEQNVVDMIKQIRREMRMEKLA
jgi:hypothetical protein